MKFRMHLHLASLCNNRICNYFQCSSCLKWPFLFQRPPKNAFSYMLNFLFQSCSFAVYAWLGFFCGADDIDVIFHFCNVLFDCRTEEKHHYIKWACGRLRDRCSVQDMQDFAMRNILFFACVCVWHFVCLKPKSSFVTLVIAFQVFKLQFDLFFVCISSRLMWRWPIL